MSAHTTIERTAEEAYDLVHRGMHPCPTWGELDTGSKAPWIAMAKHVLTQGVAIGTLDRDLTKEFLDP